MSWFAYMKKNGFLFQLKKVARNIGGWYPCSCCGARTVEKGLANTFGCDVFLSESPWRDSSSVRIKVLGQYDWNAEQQYEERVRRKESFEIKPGLFLHLALIGDVEREDRALPLVTTIRTERLPVPPIPTDIHFATFSSFGAYARSGFYHGRQMCVVTDADIEEFRKEFAGKTLIFIINHEYQLNDWKLVVEKFKFDIVYKSSLFTNRNSLFKQAYLQLFVVKF